MPITLDGSAGISGATTGAFSGNVTGNGLTTPLYPLVPATAVATTSGTTAEITGIPSWARRITVMFLQVSMSGTDNLLVQLGTSGGYVTTGYASSSGGTSSTAGFVIGVATAAREMTGHMVLTLISGTTWVGSHSMAQDAAGGNNITGAGRGVLGIVPDRIRLTPTGVTTFDLGSFNVIWE